MRVQQILLPNQTHRYVLLDDDGKIVLPVARYLKFLDQAGRARNTLRGYAFSLRLLFEFLQDRGRDYREVSPDDLAAFVLWLKTPPVDHDELPGEACVEARAKTTINQILTAVAGLYDYLWRIDDLSAEVNQRLTKVLPAQAERFRSFKGFLHHAKPRAQTRVRLLTQKVAPRRPRTCSKEELETLVCACQNFRDRLLIMTLYESSLRVGEALALWIEDIDIPRMKLHIRDRGELSNGAEIKTPSAVRSVDVSRDLINAMMDYLAVFHTDDVETNHLFIKQYGAHRGSPMTYTDVNNLIIRLRKKTGIYFTPHMLRHSSLTALSKAGWAPEHLQVRAGHRQFQTTLQMYVHPSEDDVRQEWERTQDKLRLRGQEEQK